MQQILEQLPPELDEPISDYERRGHSFIRGRREGTQHLLILQLEERGLPPTDEQRAAIEACRDLDRLQRWALALLHVDSVAALLAIE